MTDILATAWHPGSANAIAPVIKRLEENVEITTIAQEYSQDVFDDCNVPYETPDSYGVQDVSADSITEVVEQESPNIVLTGTSSQSERKRYVIEQTTTKAANDLGIPTLAVLDFWGNYKSRFSDRYDEDGDFEYLPDKVAVMDEIAEQAMIESGVNSERIVVTGNPYFDELSDLEESFTEEDLANVRNDEGVRTDSYMALFASQPLIKDEADVGYSQIDALEELLKAAEGHSEHDLSVLVKSHPRGDIAKLREVSQDFDVETAFTEDYDIRDLILASDSVFSMFSTVLVEASYLGNPAISLQPGLSTEDPLITNELDVTLPVYGEGEVSDVLEGLLSDENYFQERAPNQELFGTDGQATDRVLNLVGEVGDI